MLRDSTEIDSVLVEIAKAEKEYDKGVPKLRQLDYDPCGSTKCGPTAVASCLKYWGANGFPKLLKSPDGKRVLSDKEMVEELARKMNWKHCIGMNFMN